MDSGQYYSITTKRFTLRCAHPEWLCSNQSLYNEVLYFYYSLFMDRAEADAALPAMGKQRILRELERITVVGRNKEPVPFPLPWERLPLYFRRSALNAAIAAGKSTLERKTGRAKAFHSSVTFYKGMYRELSGQSITIRLWDGADWQWMECSLGANTFPDGSRVLSPSVVLARRKIYLDVPVRENVPDGRKAKERFREDIKICSLQFGSGDLFAVGVILESGGCQEDVRFYQGAKEYMHRCARIEERIKKAETSMGLKKGCKYCGQACNQKYWLKLKRLKEFYSHNISRQIINNCVKRGVSVIVMPEYEKTYSRYVMYASGNWSGIHLSGKIKQQIFYKAWKEGILVLETAPYGCGSRCAVCGAAVKKRKAEYCCENGHRGNRYLNFARNLGVRCINSFRSADNKAEEADSKVNQADGGAAGADGKVNQAGGKAAERDGKAGVAQPAVFSGAGCR